MKIKYQEEIAALHVKEQAAVLKIKELEAASADAWESVKETAEHVWHELRIGMAAVADKFK